MTRLLLWLTLMYVLITASKNSLRYFYFQEVHLGALSKITLYASNDSLARIAARAAFDEIDEWDHALSDYASDSEVSQLPSLANMYKYASPRLAHAISMSLVFHSASQGAFDPALGRLSKLWRNAFHSGTMPSDREVANALEQSGAAHVLWNAQTHLVGFSKEQIQFDFGGIGQGLAADAAMQVLRKNNIYSALIDISGDLLASDAPPGEVGWKISVEPEFEGDALRTKFIQNRALCVSGDRGQSWHNNGLTLSHILNPKSGRPIDSPRQSCVIANDTTTADAIATIACVMSVEQLQQFALANPGVEIFIDREASDGGQRNLSADQNDSTSANTDSKNK